MSRNGRRNYVCCATDAGGAANIAPVAAHLRPSGCDVVGSPSTIEYFERYGFRDLRVVSADDDTDGLARDARGVVCGATRYFSADRALVAAARRQGIPSVVVLDEWYLYANRFCDPRGTAVFPDLICVPDARARNEAVLEGVPADRLRVTGTPAMAALCDRLEKFASEPPPVPDCFVGVPRPWIVFLSETHSTDAALMQNAKHGFPSLGYTELTVRADLALAVQKLARACTVIEKLHPAAAQPPDLLPLADGQHWRQVKRQALLPVIWHANCVIGMRSVALIESALAGRPTLSYQPGLIPGAPPSTAERMGFVDTATSMAALQDWIDTNWDVGHRAPLQRPPFATRDSISHISQLIVEICRDTFN